METEVYYQVHYKTFADDEWRAYAGFESGTNRTLSKDEALEVEASIFAFDTRVVRTTVTREDISEAAINAQITARLRGIGWVTSRTSKTDVCWGCKEHTVVFKTYNGGAHLPYWVCHPCARVARLPID